jgi:hypothetical protein
MNNYFQMAKSYLSAKLGPSSLPETQLKRLEACFGCSFIMEKESLFYCNKCGCPKSKFFPDSELRSKVVFENAKCPEGKWKA